MLKRLHWEGVSDGPLRLALDATPARDGPQCERWQPDILHFIGHGDIDAQNGEPYLELVSSERPGPWSSFCRTSK